MRIFLAVAVGLGLSLPAVAAPLTFDAALAAAETGPSLAARVAGTAAARAAAVPARQLPDPKVAFGIRDFPVTGADAGRFNRDNFTMTTISVVQAFPNNAKRNARAGRAVADIGAATAAERLEARNVRIGAAMAWLDLHFAQRRLAALQGLDSSIDAIAATVPARLAAGGARGAQLLEPKLLKADVGDRRAALIASIGKARAELARWTGDDDPQAAGPPPAWGVDAVSLRASLEKLPSLRALDAGIAQADADIGLARAQKRPDWEVSASYGRREPAFGDLASIGVSIDLPLFARRRQDPLIVARRANADRARLERQAALRETRAGLDSALADHAMHHDRHRRSRETLVPLARQSAALERASYAAGTADLGAALGGAVGLARAELDALDREAEVASDGARINLSYGAEPDDR